MTLLRNGRWQKWWGVTLKMIKISDLCCACPQSLSPTPHSDGRQLPVCSPTRGLRGRKLRLQFSSPVNGLVSESAGGSFSGWPLGWLQPQSTPWFQPLRDPEPEIHLRAVRPLAHRYSEILDAGCVKQLSFVQQCYSGSFWIEIYRGRPMEVGWLGKAPLRTLHLKWRLKDM